MTLPSRDLLEREICPHDIDLGPPMPQHELVAYIYEHRDSDVMRAILQYLRNEAHRQGELAGDFQEAGDAAQSAHAMGARRGLTANFWEVLSFCRPMQKENPPPTPT